MVKPEISVQRIFKAIDHLSIRDKVRLAQKLQRQTWKEQLKNLFARVDKRLKKHPLTEGDIRDIVEEVRAERYESRH